MAELKRFGFGLQALVVLASRAGQYSSAEIAEHINGEATALRKILSRLTDAGIVEVSQGRGGGYTIARRPEDITLAEVYRSLQDEGAQWERMLDTTGNNFFGKKVRESFEQIVTDMHTQIDHVLLSYTIADLIK